MPKWKPGQSGNPNGRRPGIHDKRHAFRDMLKEKTEAYFTGGDYERDLAALEPRERLSFQLKALAYCLPKLRHVEHFDGDNKLEIEIVRAEPKPPLD